MTPTQAERQPHLGLDVRADHGAAQLQSALCGDRGYVMGPIALGAAADLFGTDAALGVTALRCSSWCRSWSGAWRPESFRRGGNLIRSV